MMLIKDKAWSAGFFEGEGCVYIHRKKQGGKVYYSLLISISNTRRGFIEFLERKFGGYVYEVSEKPNRKICYCFLLHGDKATKFLKVVFPYLKGKKREAILGIQLQKLKYSTNRWRKGLKGSLPFSKKDIEKRERIYQELKGLNKRGISKYLSEPRLKRNSQSQSEPHL